MKECKIIKALKKISKNIEFYGCTGELFFEDDVINTYSVFICDSYLRNNIPTYEIKTRKDNVLIFKDYDKYDHSNLRGCKYLSITDSNISLASINCPNVKNVYAGNNGISEDEINLFRYNNLKKLDIKINNFPTIISKTNDDGLIATRAVQLKRLRIYSDNMCTINLNLSLSWWLK